MYTDTTETIDADMVDPEAEGGGEPGTPIQRTPELEAFLKLWAPVPRMGNRIPNTILLPFKTPVPAAYSDEDDIFYPDLFATYAKAKGLDVVKVICVDGSFQFTDEKEWESTGIKFMSISDTSADIDTIPTAEEVSLFNNVVGSINDTLEADGATSSVIGVCGTTGFHRVGFFILAYMAEMGYSLKISVPMFNKARLPGIYSTILLKELCVRYGEEGDYDELVSTIPTPEWIQSEVVSTSELDAQSQSEAEAGAEAEAGPGEIEMGMEIERDKDEAEEEEEEEEGEKGEINPADIRVGDLVTDKTQIQNIKGFIVQMCRNLRSGGVSGNQFPGAQPVSLDKQNMVYMNHNQSKIQYRVTWKADGERYFLCLLAGCSYMVDREFRVFRVQHLHFPRFSAPQQAIDKTLLDGELVVDVDKSSGAVYPRYLAYDVIAFEGNAVGRDHLDHRMKIINERIIGPRHSIDQSKAPFRVRAKQHFPINQTRMIHTKLFPQLTHPTDGFIFTPVTPYVCGEWEQLLKWKPMELNTIDFVARTLVNVDSAKSAVGEGGGEISVKDVVVRLFVNDSRRYIYHSEMVVESVEQAREVDMRVVECALFADGWHLVRIRRDKSTSNTLYTAQRVERSIRDGIGLDELLSFTDNIK